MHLIGGCQVCHKSIDGPGCMHCVDARCFQKRERCPIKQFVSYRITGLVSLPRFTPQSCNR
jgi:hypothetical protein